MKLRAKKVKMTQLWKGDNVIPVTLLSVENNEGNHEVLAKFSEGDEVRISGMSKGKGFQGVVKRHGFHGGPTTHGQKNRLRAPGSIGPTAPQRVLKGRKMAGHMGMERITIRNIKVVEVRPESGEIFLRGAIPGNRGGIIEIQSLKI